MEELLNSLFWSKFNLDKYQEFVWELFNQTPRLRWPYQIPNLIDWAQIEFSKLEIDQDDLPLNEQIDIVIIKILNWWKGSIEKARTRQRNIISNHIKTYGKWKTNILAVFYSPEEVVWRLSYVKQDFKFINGKVTDELTPAKRFSFLIDPNNSRNVTVKKNFKPLISDSITPTVSQIKDAFSVEAVTTDFFNEYKSHYNKLLSLFKSDDVFKEVERISNQWDENFAENFVKKLMWQIVFLYFLQKKWWLWVNKWKKRGEGSQTFIRDLYNEMLNWWDPKKENGGINFFNDYLEWLFYDTLNKNRWEEHRSNYFNTKIPYLNWWLFEPVNWYIWNWPDHIIFKWNEKEANKVFWKLLDFFDLYNFTVYENDPLEQDVAVDPEMLWKIFENLLPENERKWKGSFYTPREIVHYMCKESLKEYLVGKTWLEWERIERLMKLKDSMKTMNKIENKWSTKEQEERYIEFEKDSKNIDDALASVKIIDPAVWSWAFPMWILKEIVSLRMYIQKCIFFNNDEDLQYKLKKQALENNIYWVDIDPGAVDIAKLRFWLSLIIDNDTQDIEPLPNLDYKIMQWNSLLSQLVIWDSVIDIINDDDLENDKISRKLKNYWWSWLFDDLLETTVLVQKLKFLHKKFFLEKSATEKKKLKLEIDSIEKQLIRAWCEEWINKCKINIDNIENKKTLGVELTGKEEQELENLKRNIESIKETESKFNENHIRPFFPRKLHFWEVFKDNWWFDIVIWNPPYWASFKDSEKKFLSENYITAKTRNWIKWSLNSYSVFIERWHYLLRERWNLSFIVPLSITSSESIMATQKLIEDSCSVLKIASFSDRPQQIFKNAAQSVSIISFTKDNKVNEKIFTTKMYRLNKSMTLQDLVDNISYIETKKYKIPCRYAKVWEEIELSILWKIMNEKYNIWDFERQKWTPIYYRTAGGRYYKVVTNYSTWASTESSLFFDKDLSDVIGCILSSNLLWWFNQVYTCYPSRKNNEIRAFPIPYDKLTDDIKSKLKEIYNDYLIEIEKNVIEHTEGKNKFKEYKIKKSKDLIDKIDDIIWPLYGLSNDETNFIKTYEIKFRQDDED